MALSRVGLQACHRAEGALCTPGRPGGLPYSAAEDITLAARGTGRSSTVHRFLALTSDTRRYNNRDLIRNFRHTGLKRMFDGDSSRISAPLRRRVENILLVLNSATNPQRLNLPGYRLHQLKGDQKGVWSMTVSGNWRITFRFQDGDACDVDLADYH